MPTVTPSAQVYTCHARGARWAKRRLLCRRYHRRHSFPCDVFSGTAGTEVWTPPFLCRRCYGRRPPCNGRGTPVPTVIRCADGVSAYADGFYPDVAMPTATVGTCPCRPCLLLCRRLAAVGVGSCSGSASQASAAAVDIHSRVIDHKIGSG